MENIILVLIISMVGGLAALLWFLFQPEEKCSRCGKGRPHFKKSYKNLGLGLVDCSSCNCEVEPLDLDLDDLGNDKVKGHGR
ncbi:hypothetical protein [Candidatus Contubernalis alkaliaceticus]|uniref:hypothetical protein n=1 Tax=Candidatus Contubernalis alkaliaceticus TaxID=338645 RepID=UPI001F4BF829|nr:hypothetical protein [Candidatus Contubernalis alkalaceticus]UNC91610.1 hypothetical protein HUE98_05610 [Candidatus Contubernalis alkalaceticus]